MLYAINFEHIFVSIVAYFAGNRKNNKKFVNISFEIGYTYLFAVIYELLGTGFRFTFMLAVLTSDSDVRLHF